MRWNKNLLYRTIYGHVNDVNKFLVLLLRPLRSEISSVHVSVAAVFYRRGVRWIVEGCMHWSMLQSQSIQVSKAVLG